MKKGYRIFNLIGDCGRGILFLHKTVDVYPYLPSKLMGFRSASDATRISELTGIFRELMYLFAGIFFFISAILRPEWLWRINRFFEGRNWTPRVRISKHKMEVLQLWPKTNIFFLVHQEPYIPTKKWWQGKWTLRVTCI